jgi:hypothetical protein
MAGGSVERKTVEPTIFPYRQHFAVVTKVDYQLHGGTAVRYNPVRQKVKLWNQDQ